MNSSISRLLPIEGGLSLLLFAFLPLAASGQAPSIAMQSPSETVIAGQCASFSVGVSGSSPLSYQWQQSTDGGNTWSNLADGNGVNGTGTATLVIDAATAPMSGNQFQVVATNSSGSVTSSPVTLTVTPLPAGDEMSN